MGQRYLSIIAGYRRGQSENQPNHTRGLKLFGLLQSHEAEQFARGNVAYDSASLSLVESGASASAPKGGASGKLRRATPILWSAIP